VAIKDPANSRENRSHSFGGADWKMSAGADHRDQRGGTTSNSTSRFSGRGYPLRWGRDWGIGGHGVGRKKSGLACQ